MFWLRNKQFSLCKSRLNLFLEPTSTKHSGLLDSCSTGNKSLMGFKLTPTGIHQLWVRCANHCATMPLKFVSNWLLDFKAVLLLSCPSVTWNCVKASLSRSDELYCPCFNGISQWRYIYRLPLVHFSRATEHTESVGMGDIPMLWNIL